MQVYFPNIKTPQGAIGLFDYLMASRDSEQRNVIFDSDLNLENLRHLPGGNPAITFTDELNSDAVFAFLGHVLTNFHHHRSQVFQDLYVMWKLGASMQGTFVEVGTAYPESHNNTWLLESMFGWRGVLIEPNPCFHDSIRKQRQSPLVDRAVFPQSDLQQTMLVVPGYDGVSAIAQDFEPKVGTAKSDWSDRIQVCTATLVDIIQQHAIPRDFDYLSFDTTGNAHDCEVLEQMLVEGFVPKIITVGHNFKSHRPKLYDLLTSHGYVREFEHMSKWDDWYYHITISKF